MVVKLKILLVESVPTLSFKIKISLTYSTLLLENDQTHGLENPMIVPLMLLMCFNNEFYSIRNSNMPRTNMNKTYKIDSIDI